MKDLSHLVSSLKQKAEKLVEKHELLTQENEKLSEKVTKLKEELTEKDQQFSAVNDKMSLLKIAGNVDNESTKDVKLKINEMVREIDKCIAQISR
jgi:DNA anti-recombination protein RmuC